MRTSPGCDIDERASQRRVSVLEPASLVHKLAHAFVARSRDPVPLRLRADQSIDLSDRHRALGKALDEVVEARGEPRRKSHVPIVVRDK